MVSITHDNDPYFSGKDGIDSKEIDISKRINNLSTYDFRKEIPPVEFRPKYYGGEDNVYEVFNVLEAWGLDKDFYLGNVIKYLARAGKKNHNKKEDLQKALVYLQRRINKL